MKKLLFPFALLLVQSVLAQGIVKTMFYNILDYPSAPPANREMHLRTILNEYEPDIFMVAELESEEGAQEILDEALNFYNQAFVAAPFVENTSNDWMDVQLQQLLFYRTNTFNLVETDIIQTYLRDINMYKLELLAENETATGIFFYVFIAHLKASSGEDNEQDRLSMVTEFTDYLQLLPQDAHVIFAGDFNLYSANEPAYAEILNFEGDNNITLIDPIDAYGSWHNNNTYTQIHTQSTRLSSNPFNGHGAGGGLDDRFDFILISENLSHEESTVHYVENSYAAFGNNGNCFNQNINSPNCNGTYSQELREALYNMSDHLPVVMEIETSQNLNLSEFVTTNEIEILSGTIVSEQLQIKIPEQLINSTFSIYNTLGKKVKTIPAKNALNISIDVSSLANGMYFVVFEESGIIPVKFIKSL